MLKKNIASSLVSSSLISGLFIVGAANVYAWETPKEALEQYLQFELNGGRLSSDSFADYQNKYTHFPSDDYEEGGWDSVIVVSDVTIDQINCEANSCRAGLTFTRVPTDDLSGPRVVEEELDGPDSIEVVVENRAGDWRIQPIDNYPRISLETYERF
jgi:hypothetical protein